VNGLHICDFKNEPGENECLQAIWSQGGACKKCEKNCYRKGWSKATVTADNRKICLSHHKECR